jgi:competence protein ComEC
MRQHHFSMLIVSFTAAMAVFFGWPSEPPIGVTTAIGTLSLIVLQLGDQSHRPRVRRVGLVLLAFAFGFGWAQTYTHWQDYSTGQIYIAASETWQPGATQSEPRVLDAVVDWSEPTPRGSRVDIVYTDYLGRPLGLRLYGSQGLAETLLPGCQAQLQVALEPLALPTVVDGYDPRASAWFGGQRGRGYVREMQSVDCSRKIGLAHHLARLRLSLAAHYRSSMSPASGPIAAALVTGVRGMISKPTREAFRHSGLAHMLAISGLHMALFAGSIYALLRLLAALWPGLVLRHDVRKPCAIVALLAATAYLALSGASVATQRAYIMLAIFFLAILLDRPAVTMRNVLWAAALVLLWRPHAVMQVGFQMSFAAVMALVAVYEVWQRRDRLHLHIEEMAPATRILRLGWRYGSGLALTSLIAGSVTGYLALLHFYQIGTYGLPANLLAMPLFTTLIMPMTPLSLLAVAAGLEAGVLAVMQFGLERVLSIASFITNLPGALVKPGASPAWVLPVSAVGFLILCLVPKRARWLGLVPIVLGVFFIGSGARPIAHLYGNDVIVAQKREGGLLLMRQNKHGYQLGRIAQFHGTQVKALGDGSSCEAGCGLISKDRMTIAYLTHPKRLAIACQQTDLVILPFLSAKDYPCEALLLDKSVLHANVPLQIVSNSRKLSIKKAARSRLWEQ